MTLTAGGFRGCRCSPRTRHFRSCPIARPAELTTRATTEIPTLITRGVLIDVAGARGAEALGAH
jgi:hypothetical protein